MAHNVDIGGVIYVSANKAGSKIGYSSDYVARLAREKKIAAKQIGRQWFVDPISLENFYSDANRRKKIQKEKLREARVAERKEKASATEMIRSGALQFRATPTVVEAMRNASALGALMKSTGVMIAGVFAGLMFYGTATDALVSPLPSPSAVAQELEGPLTQSALSLQGFISGFWSFFGFLDESESETMTDERSAPDTTANFPTHATQEPRLPSGVRDGADDGVVVFEEGTYSDEELESLKRSFSDEVQITRDTEDPKTGVITPVFKNRSDERYRFLMVPVAEGSGP